MGHSIIDLEAFAERLFIDGRRFDFTASQFHEAINYHDLPSGREEAMSDTNPGQYRALCERLGLHVND